MSFSTNWDVDKHHDGTEVKEHWNLRRQFMLTHKHKYPEDRLVGLSKLFYNMEFLGCIYNPKVTILVNRLSKEVDEIVQYRENRKPKYERFFVKASEAVKRKLIDKDELPVIVTKKFLKFVPAGTEIKDDFEMKNEFKPELMEHIEKITKSTETILDIEKPFIQAGQRYFQQNEFMPCEVKSETTKTKKSKNKRKKKKLNTTNEETKQQINEEIIQTNETPKIIFKPPILVDPSASQFDEADEKPLTRRQQKKKLLNEKRQNKKDRYKLKFTISQQDRAYMNRVRNQKGLFGKLVLYSTSQNPGAYGSLNLSAQKNNMLFKIELNATQDRYILYLNGQKIVECANTKQLVVNPLKGFRKSKIPDDIKEKLATEALIYLKKYCFLIIDHRTIESENISTDHLDYKTKPEKPEMPMGGIGAKMMKLMGWSGQGLGKDSTGIVEPIKAEIRVRRKGLGAPTDNAEFVKSVRAYFENYLLSGETKRLVFSSDFTKDDRATLHLIAQEFGILRSQSYGQNENRYITIERKFTGWDLVEQLLASGGSNDNYTLIKPTEIK